MRLLVLLDCQCLARLRVPDPLGDRLLKKSLGYRLGRTAKTLHSPAFRPVSAVLHEQWYALKPDTVEEVIMYRNIREAILFRHSWPETLALPETE